jgi:dTMP kinase
MARGRFITFEGGEGSGKSTQASLLAKHLEASGIDVLLTREPGGSPFAETVRAIILDSATPDHSALAETLLFYAARTDHLEATIRPALERGRWVICDRFSDSTRAYQGEVGGVDAAAIATLERIVVHPTVPDVTFLLDLDAVVGLARAAQRRVAQATGPFQPPDRYESRTVEFHERLREAFLRTARADPRRCLVIDAFRSVDEIAADIRGHVAARFGGRSG